MQDYTNFRFSYFGGGIQNVRESRAINIYDLQRYLVSNYAYKATCAIRLEVDKRKRQVMKKRLDYICPCGRFDTRCSSGLRSVSGFMVLDFDEVPDADKVVSRLPFVPLLSYVSPSGNGVKCIIDGREWISEQGFNRFNEDIYQELQENDYLFEVVKKYKLAFQAMAKYVDKYAMLDWSGADITRACYLCCDPLAKLLSIEDGENV